MKETIGAVLKPLADFFFDLVMLVPMEWVRGIFLGLLALLALWVLNLPEQKPETEDGRPLPFWRDLRLTAVGLLALQSVFYIIF